MSDTDIVVSARHLQANINLMLQFADDARDEMRRHADRGDMELSEWYRGRADCYAMAADFCQQDIEVFGFNMEEV